MRYLTLLACLFATTTCADDSGVARSGFPIETKSMYSIRNLDAALIGSDVVVVSWVADDQAWVRTLHIGGEAGPVQKLAAKAWQVRVVTWGDSYQLLVLASGKLYAWETSEENSALLVPRDTLVRNFCAMASHEGPVCASIGMVHGDPDAVLLSDVSSHFGPAKLGEVLSVPFSSPPAISMERDTVVVRVVGAVPDSTNPGNTKLPYFAEGSSFKHVRGESSYEVISVPERGRTLVERLKARMEPRVQEFRGVPGKGWSSVPPRRFTDPGADRIRNKVSWFSAERQRDLGMLVDWGMNVEWVHWQEGLPVETRVSSYTVNTHGSPRIGTASWPDTTAVLAWGDLDSDRGGLGSRERIAVGLVHADGSARRLAWDGLPDMESPILLRVLHGDQRTIFVWVKRTEGKLSIEACAIPDATLRAQPTVPFD